jgi:Carboxypeptidase regulatory-like domain/TonB dependent receptor
MSVRMPSRMQSISRPDLHTNCSARRLSGTPDATRAEGGRVRYAAFLTFLATSHAAPVVYAQQSGQASILITVVDESGATLSGAEVAVTDPARGSKAVASTTDLGTARLRELAPGPYEVLVTHGTLKAAATVLLRAGVDAALHMTLRPATYVETISVDAAPRNLLDTRSPGQSLTLDSKDAMEIPVAGNRSWFNLLPMVPGTVVLSFASNRAPFFFYHHGSGTSQHVTVVDGADVSVSTQGIPVNVPLPTSLVNQMDAKVSGIDAASPLGWGLNVAIETRSGTNRMSGSVVTSVQDASWIDSNVPGGSTATSDQTLADLTLGGPILRDRAWFLSSYRLGRADGVTGLTALEFSTLQALGKATSRPRSLETDMIFDKATFAWRDSAQQLSISHQYDRLADRASSAEFGTTNEFGGHLLSGRYHQVLRSSLLLRGTLAFHNRGAKDYNDRTDLPRQTIFRSVLDSAGRLTGVTQLTALGSTRPDATRVPETKLTGSVDLTAMRSAAGQHEVRAGVFLDRHTREHFQNYNVGGRALEEMVLINPERPELGIVPFHLRVYDSDSATLGREVGQDAAFYVQNKWRASSRLTVSAGVRVDFIRNHDRLFDVTTQRSTEIGPNVGAAFALSPTTVMRGYYGRRFSTLSETAARLGQSALGFVDHYDRNRDGTYESQLATPPSSSFRQDILIDLNDWHQPYVDELSLALERQIARPVTVGVIYLRRYYRDAAILIEQNAIYDGPRFVGYRDESLNAIYQLTNNRWNHNVYDELSVSAQASLKRLHALASYTRQWRCNAGTWHPGDPASFLQPEAFRNCKGLGVNQGSTTGLGDYDSLSGRSMAGGVQWRDHVANLSGTLDLPLKIQAALQYRFQTGPWSGPTVTRVATPDPRVGPPTVRLSTGRDVSNPLATLIRFAGRDRTDGQFQGKSVHELNLAVRKTVTFGRVNVQTGIEVFNIGNNATDLQHIVGGNQMFSTVFGQGTNRQTARSALVRFDVSF